MATFRHYQNGRWQAIVRRKGSLPQLKVFSSKQDAQRWARLVEAEIERGVFVDRNPSERTTIGELIDRYIAEVAPAKKSCRSLTGCLLFLRKHFGRLSLAALRPAEIAAYRDRRLAEGRAGGTVLKELNVFSLVIDRAIREWGYFLPANPLEQVTRPTSARGRDRRLSPAEEKRLLDSCRSSRSPFLPTIVELGLETGMRLGELLALEWSSIDLTRRIAYLRDTKNGDARTVPLSSRAMVVLGSLPRNIATPRVFWSWNRSDSFENVWRRAVNRAGIDDLRFHDLRHEAVSRFFERGFNVMEVSAISGHRTLQMLRRYTHLDPIKLAARLA